MAKKKSTAKKKSKRKKKAKSRKAAVEQLARDVGESAHQIWLAGLGMFDSAREGSGKLYTRMVKRGAAVEAQTKPKVKKAAKDVKRAVGTEVRRLESQLKAALNKIDAWRSGPTTDAASPRKAKKKATRKKATRKRAAGKKKAAPKKAAARKKAKKSAKKRATRKRAAAKKKSARRAR